MELLDRARTPWGIELNVGGGATTFDADPFSANGDPVDFSETYFTLNGGIGVSLEVSRNVDVFVDGQWFLMFADEEDTEVFASLTPEIDPQGFDTANSVPLTAGIRIKTN